MPSVSPRSPGSPGSRGSSESTVYLLDRAHPAGVLGRLATGTGLAVGLLVLLAALVDLPTLLAVVLLVVLGVAVALTALAAVRVIRPPVLLRLDEVGYELRVLRGAGESTARWSDVVGVRREDLVVGACLVLALDDGRRSVLPLRLVAGGPATVDGLEADLRARLDRAHGQRRLT